MFSSSFEQRALITRTLNPSTRDTIYGVREGNWEKVSRSTGTACYKDSGPRLTTNIEPVTYIYVGPSLPPGVSRPISPELFPFWDDKSLPQGIKDDLRVLGFRTAVAETELYMVTTGTSAEKFIANEFEKGRAFGERLVCFSCL